MSFKNEWLGEEVEYLLRLHMMVQNVGLARVWIHIELELHEAKFVSGGLFAEAVFLGPGAESKPAGATSE